MAKRRTYKEFKIETVDLADYIHNSVQAERDFGMPGGQIESLRRVVCREIDAATANSTYKLSLRAGDSPDGNLGYVKEESARSEA